MYLLSCQPLNFVIKLMAYSGSMSEVYRISRGWSIKPSSNLKLFFPFKALGENHALSGMLQNLSTRHVNSKTSKYGNQYYNS